MKQEPSDTSAQTIISVWHQGMAEAAKNPVLKQQLERQEGKLLPRFAEHYEQLKSLPRRMRRSLQRHWKRSLAGVALLMVLSQAPAMAATIRVGGACTLGRAITSANNDASPRGFCTPGSGADRIVLSTNSTITLTEVNNEPNYGQIAGPNGLPVIRSDITIVGNNSTIRRAANAPEFRIFAVNFDGRLTLRRTTVSNGSLSILAGSGLVNGGGAVNLTNSTISGNRCSSAVSTTGSSFFTMNNSAISNNSCGSLFVDRDASATVTNSTISGNRSRTSDGSLSSYGGVLVRFGSLTVAESTISGNSSLSGGGINSYVNSYAGEITVINSTISGNTAREDGGGVSHYGGNLTLINSTISGNSAAGNGGGVFNAVNANLTLAKTLISGNRASRGREVYNSADSIVISNNFNLFGHSSRAGVRGFTPGPTDIVPNKSLREILNPNLADNGGPTQTHALVRRSPAIDRVSDGTCPPPQTDQRGVRRPQDGNNNGSAACDIGSFERR